MLMCINVFFEISGRDIAPEDGTLTLAHPETVSWGRLGRAVVGWGERGRSGAVLWPPFSREGEQQGLPADMEEL